VRHPLGGAGRSATAGRATGRLRSAATLSLAGRTPSPASRTDASLTGPWRCAILPSPLPLVAFSFAKGCEEEQ